MSSLTDFVSTIGNDKLEEIKAAARPPGKAPLWIGRYCDDEQMAEIYYRLIIRADSPAEIVRVVRDLWGIQTHWNIDVFLSGLRVFKKRMSNEVSRFKDEAKKHKRTKEVKEVTKRLNQLTAKVDALGHLGYAIELQMKRLMMGHEIEVKGHMPMKFVDTMQTTLNEMLKNYVQLAIKTGILDSVPNEININLQARSNLVLEKYIGNDGNRMLRAADNFLKAIEAKCVALEQDPQTGEYREIEETNAARE